MDSINNLSSPYDAVVAGLVLALSASTDEKSQAAIELVTEIANNLSPRQIDRAKAKALAIVARQNR